MTDARGNVLPHFTSAPSPQSSGINFFAQDLSSSDPMLSDPLHYCWLGPCSVSFAVIAGHARLLYVCYTMRVILFV